MRSAPQRLRVKLLQAGVQVGVSVGYRSDEYCHLTHNPAPTTLIILTINIPGPGPLRAAWYFMFTHRCISFEIMVSMTQHIIFLASGGSFDNTEPDCGSVRMMDDAGCDAPASQDKVWQCSMQPACAGGDHVMYGWGRGADAMHLPPGTSFSVGPGTGVAHVVLQVIHCHN